MEKRHEKRPWVSGVDIPPSLKSIGDGIFADELATEEISFFS